MLSGLDAQATSSKSVRTKIDFVMDSLFRFGECAWELYHKVLKNLAN